MQLEGVRVNFASVHCDKHLKNLVLYLIIFTFISIKTLTKTYVRAKIGAVKHLHTVFLLTAEQLLCPVRL